MDLFWLTRNSHDDALAKPTRLHSQKRIFYILKHTSFKLDRKPKIKLTKAVVVCLFTITNKVNS